MSMIDGTTPGETEMGSAGEQPITGYPGQAHQTMRPVRPTGRAGRHTWRLAHQPLIG